jgi:hypothetical protein
MEKVVRIFSSFQEADTAEKEYYRSLTPSGRLAILFTLNRRYWSSRPDDAAHDGVARVYRIVKGGRDR